MSNETPNEKPFTYYDNECGDYTVVYKFNTEVERPVAVLPSKIQAGLSCLNLNTIIQKVQEEGDYEARKLRATISELRTEVDIEQKSNTELIEKTLELSKTIASLKEEVERLSIANVDEREFAKWLSRNNQKPVEELFLYWYNTIGYPPPRP